jgi:hypothetical protein
MIAYVGKHEFMGRKYGKLWGGKSASVFKPLGCKQGSWRFKKLNFSLQTSALGHQRGPRLQK